MTKMTMFTATMIFDPQGLPLLYTLRNDEETAWIAARHGTGRVWPPLQDSGFRAVRVSVAVE